jgi:hypothetical protein
VILWKSQTLLNKIQKSIEQIAKSSFYMPNENQSYVTEVEIAGHKENKENRRKITNLLEIL